MMSWIDSQKSSRATITRCAILVCIIIAAIALNFIYPHVIVALVNLSFAATAYAMGLLFVFGWYFIVLAAIAACVLAGWLFVLWRRDHLTKR